MNEVSLKPVIDELETLFSKFNKAFFEGKLEKPVITVSPDHTRGAYGWCTAWKAWQDGTKEGGYYEINLWNLASRNGSPSEPSGQCSGHFPFWFLPQPEVQRNR